MESNDDRRTLQEQLREIERGENASWVVYPPTPIWWPLLFGLWSAAFALVVGLLDGVVHSLALLGLVAVLFLAMFWDRRRRGTYPSGRPPRELWPAIARLAVGMGAVGGAAWLAGAQLGVGWAAAVAAVGSWAVVAFYEHEYAAIATRVRERLG